jgi:hypothetical protein
MTKITAIRTLPILAALLVAVVGPRTATPADRREKIAVMKVDAPDLKRGEIDSLRDGLEVGVTRAVGTRFQVITRDSAAASVGGGDKLASRILVDPATGATRIARTTP